MDNVTIPEPQTSHRTHSLRLLAHAQERIDAGDRLQASEKIWGAVAHKLQEIAKRRGWGWSSHDGFRRLANHLRKASGDPDLMTRFNAAEAFHVNFYQDARDLDELQDGLDNAKALVGLLEEANAMDKSVGIPHGLKRRVSSTGIRRLRYPRGRRARHSPGGA